jgi:hypothetical protein
MVDPPAHADDHLELLAQELQSYCTLETKIVRLVGAPPYLRVVSKDAPGLAETITCDTEVATGTVVYRWSWGQEIIGVTLGDKARSIAHVLRADPNRR